MVQNTGKDNFTTSALGNLQPRSEGKRVVAVVHNGSLQDVALEQIHSSSQAPFAARNTGGLSGSRERLVIHEHEEPSFASVVIHLAFELPNENRDTTLELRAQLHSFEMTVEHGL